MKKSLLIFCLFIFGSGCQQVDLHHNLQEIEVDEILVLLNQNGIEAKKVKEVSGQEVSWKIAVRSTDVVKARQILISNHLPRKRELGLSGVYKDKGLIPTPDEQKARFLLALKGEIINSLHKIPGVVDVDVVLNVPTENEFSELDPVKKRPTASVVVKTRNDPVVAQAVTEGKLQRFVANTVPNLDPNDVAVIVSRSETGVASVTPTLLPPPLVSPTEERELPSVGPAVEETIHLAGLKISPTSVGRFKFYIIGLLLLLTAISTFLLFNIMRLNRLRLQVQRGGEGRTAIAGGQSSPLLTEGQVARGGMEGTFDMGAEQRR